MKHTHQLSLVHLLLEFSSMVQVKVEEELRKYRMSLVQFTILSTLADVFPERLDFKELRLRMTRRTSDFTRIVDRLIDKNLVERFECPNDRRKTKLSITASGQETLKNIQRKLAPVGVELQQVLKKNAIEIDQALINSLNKRPFAA